MKIRTIIGLTLIIINIITIFGIFPANTPLNLPITRAEVQAVPIESQDIIMNISRNASAIGPNSVIEYSVELTNSISESLYNISTNVSEITNDLLITPAIDPLFTISSLDPESSASFQFVTQYSGGNGSSSAVDLALLIDASGSMGEEINSVKAELNNLITTLSAEIPDLRIGVIVYGWGAWSEYPQSNPHNYIQFTDDFASIETFINSLYASGGNEPWGDALNLANKWDWRESASKLIILVGDEDCDPGMIVGNEFLDSDPSGTYNGSDLLDEVISLNNKGVIISTVICEGASPSTINQFQWIAAYTEGTSVSLPQLESEGINLPSIIQEWTLELGREYYREIILTVVWQDENSGMYFNTQSSSFWLDFSSPSVIISKTITPTGTNQFSVDFLINVDDISPIDFVNLYHNAYGSWMVDFLSPIENTSYYRIELQNVTRGVNLSYLVESSDILRNIGSTSVFWIIVEPKFDVVGEEVAIWVETDDKIFSNLKISYGNSYYFILSGPANIDLITMNIVNVDTNETINSLQSEFLNVSSSYWRKIIRFDLNPGDHALKLSYSSESGNFTMSYAWITIEEPVHDNFYGSMTDSIRVYGVVWPAYNGTYFSFDNEQSSPLVLRAEVYNGNWELVATFTVTQSLMVPKNGTYFILVWATLRTGDFIIQNTENAPETTFDPYYSHTGVSATTFPNLLLTLIFMFSVTIYIRKGKMQK